MWLSKPPPGIQLNRNHPLAQGLVGCWLFNEGAGLRANDLSGNGNHGTLTGFEPFSATSKWTGGNHGTALQFDGVNDYVDVGDRTSLNITKAITVSAWVNTSDTKAVQYVTGHGNTGFIGWYLSVKNGVNFYMNVATGTNVAYAYNSGGGWVHVVGIYNGSSVIVYVNGVAGIPVAFTGDIVYTGVPNTWIGQIQGSGGLPTRFFNGTIDGVRIYNRALNAQEIQQLYAQPYAMFWNPSERIRKLYDQEI